MKGRNIITINGRAYDAVSGLAVPEAPAQQQGQSPAPKPVVKPTVRAFSDIGPAPKSQLQAARPASPHHVAKQQVPHATVHQSLQKSSTLHRAALKRPEAQEIQAKPTVAHHKSTAISKFAARPQVKPAEKTLLNRPAAAVQPQQPQAEQPVQKALAQVKQVVETKAESKPQDQSKQLKEQLIRERIAEAEAAKANKPRQSRWQRFSQRRPKLATVFTSSIALLLLAGYLTYINLPNLSMKVAATRAGVTATFPNYKPDGYSLNGPISYSPGEVNVAYKSNTNAHGFTIKQKSSNWDSQAVLDNYVSKQTDTYLTFQERGLVVYTYGNKAAWSNGGVLYTVEGDAPLSSEQILKLAASM